MPQVILKNDANHLQTLISKYILKEHLTDVTLVSDDLQTFKAHKLVLSAFSRVMERLFLMTTQTNEHTVLHLRGFKGLLIQKILKYMYFGEVNVESDEETPFKNFVTELDIIGLYVTKKVTDDLQTQQDILSLKTKHSILNQNKISLNVLQENEHTTDEIEYKQETHALDLSKQETHEEPYECNKDSINNHGFQETSQGNRKEKHYKVIEGVESIYECVFCTESYPTKILLNKHTRNYHSDESDAKQFQCKNCHKTYEKLDRLEYHFHAFHRAHVFQCIACDYTSGNKEIVHQHYLLHHEHSVRFPCNQCAYVAKKNRDLKYHISAIHEGTKERVKCDECGALVKNLRPHKKMKHQKIKYPCSRCPFQASSMAYLKSHEAGLHDGIKTKCSKCDFLGSDFVVKQHIVRVHDGVRHRCDQCTMVYKSGGQLKKHQMKKHGINHIKRDYQRDNDNIGMKLGAKES